MEQKGIPAYGLHDLQANVEKLGPEDEILGFAYSGPSGTGQFFFQRQDLKLLGFVIVLQ